MSLERSRVTSLTSWILWSLRVGVESVGVVWLAVFLSAERLQQKLGPQVMTAFERLMGLILTAMSIEMLLGGIREFVQSL